MSPNIILDYLHLQPTLEKLRQQQKKIVLTQGSFDMIHIGHGRYLKQAKSYGDVLFVGTDSDDKIRARKGKGRPVVPEDERLEMLTYLTPVDYVVLKPFVAPKWSLIKLIKPDILVATQDTYSADDLKKLKKYCKKIVVLDRMATTSTSAKLRLVQINEAQKIESKLTQRLIGTIEEVLSEFRQ